EPTLSMEVPLGLPERRVSGTAERMRPPTSGWGRHHWTKGGDQCARSSRNALRPDLRAVRRVRRRRELVMYPAAVEGTCISDAPQTDQHLCWLARRHGGDHHCPSGLDGNCGDSPTAFPSLGCPDAHWRRL